MEMKFEEFKQEVMAILLDQTPLVDRYSMRYADPADEPVAKLALMATDKPEQWQNWACGMLRSQATIEYAGRGYRLPEEMVAKFKNIVAREPLAMRDLEKKKPKRTEWREAV